jgi:hypothetical protein
MPKGLRPVFVLDSDARVWIARASAGGAVSPILVRPVREQLEHDRIIRLLVAKYKRKYTVAINPGGEQNAQVGSGIEAQFPDLVLTPPGHSRKVVGIVEVETGESVNGLEAMGQWGPYGRFPLEFILYVPAGSADTAKRLCADNKVGVTEIWSYHPFGDQMRFTQVHRAPVEQKLAAAAAAERAARKAAGVKPSTPPRAKSASGKSAKPAASGQRKSAPAAKAKKAAVRAAKPKPERRAAKKR